jgi:heat shock protein HslJ
MKSQHLLLVCAVLANLALTIGAGCATKGSDAVNAAASVPLVGTSWRLTQLDGAELNNPENTNAVGLRLDPQNTRVVGFAGCNRMFGGYALDGESLKFAQMGGTKMACMDQERMQLEQRYFDMLTRVARWKISGQTLEFLDSGGAPIATFAAATPAQTP